MTPLRTAVYERRGKLYVLTSSQTTLWSWTEVGECTVLDVGGPSEALGDAVRKHLAASTTGVPFRGRGAPQEPDLLLKAAKVRSRHTFEMTAKCLTVEADSSQVVVIPHRNDRPGFFVIAGAEIRLPLQADTGDLGRAIQRGLELSV
jgi:hypothetical protein